MQLSKLLIILIDFHRICCTGVECSARAIVRAITHVYCWRTISMRVLFNERHISEQKFSVTKRTGRNVFHDALNRLWNDAWNNQSVPNTFNIWKSVRFFPLGLSVCSLTSNARSSKEKLIYRVVFRDRFEIAQICRGSNQPREISLD